MSGRAETREIDCPYCGEPVDTLLDSVGPGDRYVEDCPVCCRPIEYAVSVGADGVPRVTARRDDE